MFAFVRRALLLGLGLVGLLALGTPLLVGAQDGPAITDRGVTIEFPQRLTFAAHLASEAPIDRVILEYGVQRRTCGTVTAKAFPVFTAAPTLDVSWTWEMLKSGAEPPGAIIWYRWRVHDTAGHEVVSDQYQTPWLDIEHTWQARRRDALTLHWYTGSTSFADQLLDAGTAALNQMGQTTGASTQAPIDVYIYASASDLHDALLYEPGWTGGEAFPPYNLVVMGVAPDQLDWGRGTVAHELTHILVGQVTFSCLSNLPTWLNEGLAVYGQGGPEVSARDLLQQAITQDRLLSIHTLSGNFSEHPSKADLSYGQSYSLTNYLITQFGAEKLRALLGDLRQGMTIEDALQAVYGFGLDGLEDRWRASLGAPPRHDSGAPATALPTPVPTYPPISGAPVALAITPFPTAAPRSVDAAAAPNAPDNPAPAGMTPILGAGLAALLVLLLTLVLVFFQRRKHT